MAVRIAHQVGLTCVSSRLFTVPAQLSVDVERHRGRAGSMSTGSPGSHSISSRCWQSCSAACSPVMASSSLSLLIHPPCPGQQLGEHLTHERVPLHAMGVARRIRADRLPPSARYGLRKSQYVLRGHRDGVNHIGLAGL